MSKLSLLMLTTLFNNYIQHTQGRRDWELKGIDIKKEYNLIKQKKSGLSRALRERVIELYKKENTDK